MSSRGKERNPSGVEAAPRTASLSTARVESYFMDRVYRRLATVYDVVFGPALQAGREQVLEHMAPATGDRILEVGIGTGLSAGMYPRGCRVVGIDYSVSMLVKARRRVLGRGARSIELLRMDAARLAFPDGCFDSVHASYVLSVVPDPVRVVREMFRVCRPGGKVLFLNHFRSGHPLLARAERMISPLTVRLGFRADVDLGQLLERAELDFGSLEKESFRGLWTLVAGTKDGMAGVPLGG